MQIFSVSLLEKLLTPFKETAVNKTWELFNIHYPETRTSLISQLLLWFETLEVMGFNSTYTVTVVNFLLLLYLPRESCRLSGTFLKPT